MFNVSQKVKQKLLLVNAPCQGQKMASTPVDDRSLLRFCKIDRTKSSRELSTEQVLSNGRRFSTLTIRRCLNAMGYKGYIVKKKPLRKS